MLWRGKIYLQSEPAGLIFVSLKAPAGPLQMGDVPVFTGKVTNQGTKTLNSLVIYLSLVSLMPGREHPVDLEDWSAQKAIRLNHLPPVQTAVQQ